MVGLKEQGPGATQVVSDLRVRAFTLLARTYDAARSAGMYLRWKFNDVDSIAPSLYAGRSNGRRKEPEAGRIPRRRRRQRRPSPRFRPLKR